MSVVVADAIVKISADTSQAKAGLADVAAEARATGEQLDALAAKFARAQGGTAADWRPVVEKLDLSAKAVQDALGGAAQGAEKVAAGAGKAAAATAEAGSAAEILSKHFDLSAGTLVRAGGALLGVGLGLSAAVGIADKLHDLVAGIVEGQLSWESSLRRTIPLYGDAAAGIVATSAAQSALPDVLGTQREFLQANLNARYLASRYGLPQADITGLTTASGRASFALGLTDEKARADLQARMLAFADQGGSGLRDIGVEGDPLSIARRLGLSAPEGLGALTPAQLKQAQTLIATEGANQLAIGAGNAGGAALAASSALEKAKEAAANSVRASIEQTISGQVPFGQAAGEAAVEAQLGIGQPQDQPYARSAAAQQAEADYQKAADAAQQYTEHLQTAQAALDDTRQKLEALGVTANSATAHLLQFAGSLEDVHSIARGDIAAQALSGVAARAIGPNPLIGRSEAELYAQASAGASQQAYQSFVAGQARTAIARDNGVHDFLTGQLGGPNAAAAQAALAEEQRRTLGNLMEGRADQAGALAGRAGAEAQAALSAVNLRQGEREVAVAGDLAALTKDRLGTEAQLAPLLLQQADLQDRILVAGRDNLETRKALIAAQQAALPGSQALAVTDEQSQLLDARIAAEISARRQGTTTGLDIGAARQELLHNALDVRPAQNVAAIEGQQAVSAVQRTQAGEDLGRQARLADLEGTQRALEDQAIPLQASLRLTQAREDAVRRTLELLAQDDAAEIAAAQHRLDEALGLALQAEAAKRAAQDYQQGLEKGRDAAKEAKALLADIAAMPPIRPLAADPNSADARIANGLGGGGLGPAAGERNAGAIVNMFQGATFNVRSDADIESIRQIARDAANDAVAGLVTGAPPQSLVPGITPGAYLPRGR